MPPPGYLEDPFPPLIPNWRLTTPVKSCIANCGQQCQTQRWFVLTAYGNIPSP